MKHDICDRRLVVTFAIPAKRAAQRIKIGQVHKYDNRCIVCRRSHESCKAGACMEQGLALWGTGKSNDNQSQQTRGSTAETNANHTLLLVVNTYRARQQRTMLQSIMSCWLSALNSHSTSPMFALTPHNRGHIGRKEESWLTTFRL